MTEDFTISPDMTTEEQTVSAPSAYSRPLATTLTTPAEEQQSEPNDSLERYNQIVSFLGKESKLSAKKTAEELTQGDLDAANTAYLEKINSHMKSIGAEPFSDLGSVDFELISKKEEEHNLKSANENLKKIKAKYPSLSNVPDFTSTDDVKARAKDVMKEIQQISTSGSISDYNKKVRDLNKSMPGVALKEASSDSDIEKVSKYNQNKYKEYVSTSQKLSAIANNPYRVSSQGELLQSEEEKKREIDDIPAKMYREYQRGQSIMSKNPFVTPESKNLYFSKTITPEKVGYQWDKHTPGPKPAYTALKPGVLSEEDQRLSNESDVYSNNIKSIDQTLRDLSKKEAEVKLYGVPVMGVNGSEELRKIELERTAALAARRVLVDKNADVIMSRHEVRSKIGSTPGAFLYSAIESSSNILNGISDIVAKYGANKLKPMFMALAVASGDELSKADEATENIERQISQKHDEFYESINKAASSALGQAPENIEKEHKTAGFLGSMVPYVFGGEFDFPMMFASSWHENKKELLNMSLSLASASLMKYGMKVSKGDAYVNNLVRDAIESQTGKIEASLVNSYIRRNAVRYAKEAAIGSVSTAAAFAAINPTSVAAASSIKYLSNLLPGREVDVDNLYDTASHMGESILSGIQDGLVFGGIMHTLTTGRTDFSDYNDFKQIESFTDPRYRDALKSKIQQNLAEGVIDKAQADAMLKNIKEISDKLTSIPDSFSGRDKFEAYRILRENERISKESENLDPTFKELYQKRIDANKEKLKQLSLKHDQVYQHEKEGGSTFVGGRNQMGEKVSSVSIFPERTVKIEGPITQEDIDNFKEANKDLLEGNEDILSVGTWKDEDGKTNIDISAITPHADAEALGRMYNQKAVFNLEKSKEVSTGGTGEPVEGMKSEVDRVKDIRELVGRTKASEADFKPVDIEDVASRLGEGNRMIKAARNAVSALSGLSDKNNITLRFHDSNASMQHALNIGNARDKDAKFTNGNFAYVKNSKGGWDMFIDVNLKLGADEATIRHEFTHGILLHEFGENPALLKNMKDAIRSYGNMFNDSNIIKFTDMYKEVDRAEEYLAELSAIRKNIKPGVLSRIAEFINNVASKSFGDKFIPFKNVNDSNDIIRYFASLSEAVRTGEISKVEKPKALEIEVIESGLSTNIGDPVSINEVDARSRPRLKFPSNPLPLSFVTDKDVVSIEDVLKDIHDNNKTVWFWMADQLGRGMYYDEVVKGEHYLDAGPSFAFDPKNRSNKVLWASGLSQKYLAESAEKADYIFFISGSPEKAKMFNKSVLDLVGKRIDAGMGFDKFKKGVKKFGRKTDNLTAMIDILDKYNSFADMVNSTDRKPFLLAIDEIRRLKTTPKGSIKEFLEKAKAIVDPNDLRDGFYRDNEFSQNDIMLIGKPTGAKNGSSHGTYLNTVLGEVVGVPDRRVNAWELMPESIKQKYPKAQVSQKAKIIAAEMGQFFKGEGGELMPIKSKQQLITDKKILKKMTEDEDGNYLFYHYSPSKITGKIDPRFFGRNLKTGRDERPGIGISMYYTRPDYRDVGGNYGYVVKIPKDKVYPFNSDPLNLYDKAEAAFQKMYPGQAFDPNKQVAFISQEAAKLGYDMTVAKWGDELRAQTTKPMKGEWYERPHPEYRYSVITNKKYEDFKANEKKPKSKQQLTFGDNVNIEGVDVKIPEEKEQDILKAQRGTKKYFDDKVQKMKPSGLSKEELQSLLDSDNMAILTGTNPDGNAVDDKTNESLNKKAEEWLKENNYKYHEVTGKYGQVESSFIVEGMTASEAMDFAEKFKQDSVAHSEGLVYRRGAINKRDVSGDEFGVDVSGPEEDFVSAIKTKDGEVVGFRIGYDFDKEEEYSSETKSKQRLDDVESTAKALEGTPKTNKSENKNTDIGYHGTPYNYDIFDASKIGTGEGAAKRGRGIYFMRSKRLAPYFANINSEDAPIHIGKGKSKVDKNKIDPRIFEISGFDNLKLKKGTSRNVSEWALKQQEFVEQGFDGFETEKGEITVFPESIGKLKIDSKNTIGEFIGKNNDIDFREWTTNKNKEKTIAAQAYHADKAAGKETELTKAVEELLGEPSGVKSKQRLDENGQKFKDEMQKEFDRIKDTDEKGKLIDRAIKKAETSWASWIRGNQDQYDEAVRQFKKDNGVKIKSGPSQEKISGQKPSTVAVKESTALKDQIKLEAKAAREGAKSIKDFMRSISEGVKSMVGRGVITANQASAITKRMAFLNPKNAESVDKFYKWVDKIFSNADYADRLKEANTNRSKIKGKLNSKEIPAGLIKIAKKFSKIDPSEVSDIDEYNEMSKMLWEGLRPNVMKRDKYDNIVESKREAVNMEDMNRYIESQEDAVQKKKEKAEKEAEEDPEIIQKLQDSIDQLSDIARTILETGANPIDGTSVDLTSKEKSILKKFLDMKPKEKKTLMDTEYALKHFIENGDTGLMEYARERYDIDRKVEAGINALKRATGLGIKRLPVEWIVSAFRSLKNIIPGKYEESRRNYQYLTNSSISRIDTLVRNIEKGSPVFKALFRDIAAGYSFYKNKTKEMNSEKIYQAMLKGLNGDIKKAAIANYKITMYLRQLEHESNPGSSKSLPAMDYMKATIEAAKLGTNKMNSSSRKVLEKLIQEYSYTDADGVQHIDKDKIYNSFSEPEKNAVSEIQKLYRDLLPFAKTVAEKIRNNPFDDISNYVSIAVNDSRLSAADINTLATEMQAYLPSSLSTKAGQIEDRTGVARSIDMDPFSTANKAVRNILLDHSMTSNIMALRRITENFREESVNGDDDVRLFAIALDNVSNEVVKSVVGRSYMERTTVSEAMDLLTRKSVTYMLAGLEKITKETGSNIAFVSAFAPAEFANGAKYTKYWSSSLGGKILEVVNSYNQDRLYPHGGDIGKVADTESYDISVSSSQNIPSDAQMIAFKAYYNTLNRAIKTGRAVSEAMLGGPDIAMARPLWFGSMAMEFKRITGKEIDFDKIANSDAEYLESNMSAIEQARDVADKNVIDAANTKNPFLRSPKLTLGSRNTQLWSQLNNFLSGFSRKESEVLIDSIDTLYRQGQITKTQAVKTIAAVTARAATYRIIGKVMGGILASAGVYLSTIMNDDEDDKLEAAIRKNLSKDASKMETEAAQIEKDYFTKYSPKIEGIDTSINVTNRFMTSDEEAVAKMDRRLRPKRTLLEEGLHGAASGIAQLLLNRNFGNLQNSLITAPIFEEYINSKFINNENYDKYEDQYLVSGFPSSKQDIGTELLSRTTGQFSLILSGGIDLYKEIAKMTSINDELKDVDKKLKDIDAGISVKEFGSKEKGKLDLDKKRLEERYEKSKRIFATKISIGATASFAAVPGLKDIVKVAKKASEDVIIKTTDWDKLVKWYEKAQKQVKGSTIPAGVTPVSNRQPQQSQYFKMTSKGYKLGPKGWYK